jgi:hypothetical protein
MSIFPITKEESNLLHCLGWNSGYGWSSEFDWWFKHDDHNTADNINTQLMLVEHVTTIRKFTERAGLAAIEYINLSREEHPT